MVITLEDCEKKFDDCVLCVRTNVNIKTQSEFFRQCVLALKDCAQYLIELRGDFKQEKAKEFCDFLDKMQEYVFANGGVANA